MDDSNKRTKSTAATALIANANAHSCIDIPLSRAYTGNPSILLERAARETQVVLPLVQSHEKEAQRSHEQQDSQDSLQFAMNAAETLLKVTESTTEFAEAIRNVPKAKVNLDGGRRALSRDCFVAGILHLETCG